jgi:tetratricopeptide (TPR) repeat protein
MKTTFQLRPLFILSLVYVFSITFALAQVKVYEGTEIIPTYQKGQDETSPMFYTGRSVQGAQGKIYPYPSQAKLGDSLVDVTYEMVYLENEYLRVKVLPAFGGRLFSAIDKTNGHELFHTNSVIKPDLIGTLGAWVSGGIEWCFPHHHRTSTMMKSDYRMVENDDGSATVWIGETEKSRDMRGVIGMTLRPGRSYIEVDYRINNTNTLTTTFLFWANVAITSNEDFRTFWPPSQEIGVFHNNRSFVQWPISTETPSYGRTSYPEGVDLTWWKNHPNPVSFFMWDGKEGFIGGYDYGQNAGTVHVGDPHENSASKLWQFGPGLQGQNARRKLTDDGKAYVELMTGSFSNNQPDYSWILPHSVKDAKNYWYPIRNLEIVKNSTIDASVTLQMRDAKTVFYGFNTTKTYENAKVLLKSAETILAEKSINIDPATPFTDTFKSRKPLDEYELYVSLEDKDGKELVSYRPYKLKHPKLPEVQRPVKKPEEISTVEDLYLTGRFVEQFSRPGIEPDDYYLAALEKSPNDYRVNLALGQRRLGQMKYEEALSYLQKAADKLKIKYYQPKEGELYYYMGMAQKALGQPDKAYASFARATWYYQWFSAANYQLAQMESKQENFEKALDYIKEAYSTNNRDGRIVTLYASLLRKMGMKEKAVSLLDKLLAYDPLNFTALYEKGLCAGDLSMNVWHKNMQDLDNNYLEIATHYLNIGFLDDGITLLSSLEDYKNPLVAYYLYWFEAESGNDIGAKNALQSAKNASLNYAFPYRPETEIVLNKAIARDPEDVTAYYLLGNMLYDNRPIDAMGAWQKAGEINNSIPLVWRNLAFGSFYRDKNPAKAIEYMTKAIDSDNSNPLWYAELSKYYDESDDDFKDNLEILKKNIDIVKEDVAAPKTYVQLLNLNGEYDAAIEFLGKHHFRTWEGGRETYWHYVDSHTLKAKELMKSKNYKEAISHLEKAMQYPENLEVGKPTHDEKNAMIYYYMGLAYDEMGSSKKANDAYLKSANAENGRGMYDLLYYQAKANEKLGKADTANKMFTDLIDRAQKQRSGDSNNTLVAVEEASATNKKAISESYYLEALGNMGLGKTEEAKKMLEEALKVYKNNLWAKNMMDI